MTNLSVLRDRVRAAGGPDRELDAEIAAALLDATKERNYYAWQSGRPKGTPLRPATEFWRSRSPNFTASLDAALALVERVLPGWSWGIDTHDRMDENPFGWAWALIRPGDHSSTFYRETAPTAPLALMAALLGALIAQRSGADREPE